jgi:hypothetical protein
MEISTIQASAVLAQALESYGIERDISTNQSAAVPARPLDLVVQIEISTMLVHINVLE